ncbi:hypothetical protein G7085_16070 [Tessaracoccus sp. HDW20]|uniref:hypothetical protein n=1 Tax=Tessaracoccus coleopterorum TaxID=2714950 RepID=UPI0018D27810|nr:hypothetical protein [Tessaracoccus coleopterorum]NHB85602.1 hypothetical protein [Tessaracoccus coleopterorum]
MIWLQVDEGPPPTPPGVAVAAGHPGGGAMSIVRLVGGLVLVVTGIALILATQIGLTQLPGCSAPRLC